MRDQYQVEYASATHGFDDLPSTARRNNFANSASPSATVSGGNQAQSVNLSVAEESNTYHRRNISWGLNEVINQGVPGPSLRERSDASSTLSQSQSGERNTRRTIIELPSGRGIINPMETEAETYLLRAIERTGTEVDSEANILSNVSDAAVQAMRDRQEAEDQNSSPNHSVQHTKVPSREPPSWGGSSATSNRVGFRNVASARNLTSVSPQHIRKMTLDEQLFGLTHAMDAMHAESVVPIEEDIPAISSVPSRLRSNTFESSTGNTSEVPEGREDQRQPASSYEIFAQNADIFYQQALPEAIGHSGPIRRASTRNFGDDTGFGDDKVNESGVTDEEQGKAFTVTNDDNDVKMGKKDASLRGGSSSSTLRVRSPWTRARSVIFDSWGITSEMKNFIRPKQNLIRLYFQIAVLYLALPSLGTAAILFYLVGNPPTGVLANNGNPIDGKLLNTNGEIVDPNVTSVSFYLVFAGVRQVVTFTLAMGTQLVLIDFLAIDRGYLFKLGSRLPLFIMQARGWPFVLFFWSVYNWALLAGSKPFFSHWLYFQNLVSLFNATNPSGNVIASVWNHRVLSLATGVSFAVAIKRFWMGIFLGRQTYHRYSDKLATLMQKMLLISQVAGLSRQIVSPQGRGHLRTREETISAVLTEDQIDGLMNHADDDSDTGMKMNAEDSVGITTGTGYDAKGMLVIDPDDRNPLTGKLSNIQKNRITRLLGAWEEPTQEFMSTETPSIASLMHFRRAMSHLRTQLPFSASFGTAGTREECVASSQEVFRRLMTLSEYDDVLNFEVLALLGAKTDGNLDQDKLMELIKLFRPDRDGSLSIVHFVRSVDKVYKDIRMLRASVHNSSKVDGQFEAIFNFIFYVVIIVVILNTLGFDPLALFVSISGLVLGFAFMIGTASSKYFEGLLFILVRRPFGIGDCIHVSDPNSDTNYTGSAFWYVEDITLFSTQVRYFYTNERASLSNGSLASSRIINSSRSYNAGVYHYLKFPLDVPYDKVKIFHEALETFVRNRPREWIGLSSFRATEVNANLGYIEYMVCIDHRESWAYWTQVRTSQSDLMGFGVELAKKLDIVYKQPTLPIDLNIKQSHAQDFFGRMATENSTSDSKSAVPTVESGPSDQATRIGHRPSFSRDFQTLAAQFPHRAPMTHDK